MVSISVVECNLIELTTATTGQTFAVSSIEMCACTGIQLVASNGSSWMSDTFNIHFSRQFLLSEVNISTVYSSHVSDSRKNIMYWY